MIRSLLDRRALFLMNDNHHDQLQKLLDNQISIEERIDIAKKTARAVLSNKIDDHDVPFFYQVMVQFWRNLGSHLRDRNNPSLFLKRSKLATQCMLVSTRLPGGQKFFKHFPKIELAEGPNRFKGDELIIGRINYKMFQSIYEFHLEYPIESVGVIKDQISVITSSGSKIPIFDWCEENDIIVYCNRCGLDITYEVSRDCPKRKHPGS
jgi:hypothetical protein